MSSRNVMEKGKEEFFATHVTGRRIPCAFCKRDDDNEIIYGKCYAIGDIQCHYSCVYMSRTLKRRGGNKEGLFGYLYEDMLEEIERSKDNICSYCKKGGATLSCTYRKCQNHLHFPCGKERHAVFTTCGFHRLFCEAHGSGQNAVNKIKSPAYTCTPDKQKKNNLEEMQKENNTEELGEENQEIDNNAYLIEHYSKNRQLNKSKTSQKSTAKKKKLRKGQGSRVTKRSNSQKRNNLKTSSSFDDSVDKFVKEIRIGRKTKFITQKKRVYVKRAVEPAVDRKTRSESRKMKNKEYEVLERENDCNILILKV